MARHAKRFVLPCSERRLGPHDPEWPAGLAHLADPPAQLRVAGTLEGLEQAIAVVGTRHADEEGVELAQELAADLARAGCVVLSGGARGIDAAAHQGALEAGGRTAAVLATGFHPPYPPRHAALFERIAAQGALLSEADDGCAPMPGRFIQRNRLIAALGRAVVVVQAPARSGALSTAARARRLGRPVLAVPASPRDPRGAGCLGLLRDGADICTRARDVLSVAALGAGSPLDRGIPEPENMDNLSDVDADGRAVWKHMGRRARDADEIGRRSGLPPARVQRALLGLMLLGLIEERGTGRYVRTPDRHRFQSDRGTRS